MFQFLAEKRFSIVLDRANSRENVMKIRLCEIAVNSFIFQVTVRKTSIRNSNVLVLYRMDLIPRHSQFFASQILGPR